MREHIYKTKAVLCQVVERDLYSQRLTSCCVDLPPRIFHSGERERETETKGDREGEGGKERERGGGRERKEEGGKEREREREIAVKLWHHSINVQEIGAARVR
jgi:hypothetical protein